MDPSLDVKAGDVLAGKYRIERVLGQGGMGVVVQATHLHLDERVAIKFLIPSALNVPESVARFAREARAAVKIKSEHVARVIDVGTLETGCPYMVMEYLHGRDLSQLVVEQGPLPIEQAVDFVLQASEAIAEAHALGIVHRDLKPSNLFLIHRADGSPCVKVLDFGISKTTGMSGSGPDLGMTRTTAVMGSPLYMSPEQMASSRNVDARTDIWALGAILFELLTGQVPFAADTMPQLCAMVLQEPAPPLRGRLPMAPEGLEAAILRCLEKTPVKRFANIAEFAAAIAPFAPRWGRHSVERISRVLSAAGQLPNPVDTLPSASSSPPIKAASTQQAWDQSQPAPRSRAPLIVAGAALLVVASGAVLGLKLLGSGETTTQSTGAAPAEPPSALPVAAPSVVPVAAPLPVAAPQSAAAVAPSAGAGAVAPSAIAPASAAPAPSPAPDVKPATKARPASRPAAKTPPRPAAPPPAPAAPAPPAQRPVSDLYSDRK